MKGFKARILRTLKSIPHVAYPINQGRVLILESRSDEFFDAESSIIHQTLPITGEEQEQEEIQVKDPKSELTERPISPLGGEINVSSDKENIGPKTPLKDPIFGKKIEQDEPICTETAEIAERSDLELPPYRRPDLTSPTLFDPELLAAFRQAVSDHNRSFEEAKTIRSRSVEEESDPILEFEPPAKIPRTGTEDPFTEFELKIPPGGNESVIIYTTSLRGIRKTFEDCNRVRLLLENLGISFNERDISMDLGYREELWRVLGWRAIPPRLFIMGRYIGGAEEVVGLHEQGKLRPLLWCVPIGRSDQGLCKGCGGMRFMMCSACNGSHKLYDGEADSRVPCLGCNENGLVPCPFC